MEYNGVEYNKKKKNKRGNKMKRNIETIKKTLKNEAMKSCFEKTSNSSANFGALVNSTEENAEIYGTIIFFMFQEEFEGRLWLNGLRSGKVRFYNEDRTFVEGTPEMKAELEDKLDTICRMFAEEPEENISWFENSGEFRIFPNSEKRMSFVKFDKGIYSTNTLTGEEKTQVAQIWEKYNDKDDSDNTPSAPTPTEPETKEEPKEPETHSQKMSTIFKRAWEIFRNACTETCKAIFSLCLKQAWEESRI